MPTKRLKVLHEDNHLLAVAKPAGVPTMGAAPGVTSVLDLAKAYLAAKYDKPGAVYLGVVSRLDAPVTGVLLLARTSKAAARLTEAFAGREVEKVYLATVEGELPPPDGTVVHHLAKDDRSQRMVATHAEAPGAQRAELAYEVLLTDADKSLVVVRLLTGRKHQIRVQLAKLGAPIRGDQKYGSQVAYARGIDLHAWRLRLEHPVRKKPLALECALPPKWGSWREGQLAVAFERLGGEARG